jgi:hypothetical protein
MKKYARANARERAKNKVRTEARIRTRISTRNGYYKSLIVFLRKTPYRYFSFFLLRLFKVFMLSYNIIRSLSSVL